MISKNMNLKKYPDRFILIYILINQGKAFTCLYLIEFQSSVYYLILIEFNFNRRKMKSGRGKENVQQNSAQQFIASTYRVESDQKDLIIKALKNDHQSLKKNEGQYYKIHDQYKQLQHKHKLLSDEKTNDDRQFKMRHQAAVRNINQLRTQIDALKAELRDKKLQINDLQSDSHSLKHELDQKNIQFQNYKNDFKGAIADSEQLGAQKQNLSIAATKLRAIVIQTQEEDRLLKEDNDSVNKRFEQLEKYHHQLLIQEKILREKIQNFENENNQLDGNINQLNESLTELQLAIKKANDEYMQLQEAVTELNLLNEKYRTEAQHVQKNIQAQALKNNNLAKSLKNAEYTHKVRNGQLQEGDRQVNALKAEKESLDQINNKLAEDLQACRVHLQNLGLINIRLVEHLQGFSSQDESIREVLNRKVRVQNCRQRATEVQNTSYSYKSSSANDKYLGQTRTGTSRKDYR